MNAIAATHIAPRSELVGVERPFSTVTLRDDPFFQGWGPKL